METIEMGRQAQHRRSGKVNYQGHHAARNKILKKILFLFQHFCASDKLDGSVDTARDVDQLFGQASFIFCFRYTYLDALS